MRPSDEEWGRGEGGRVGVESGYRHGNTVALSLPHSNWCWAPPTGEMRERKYGCHKAGTLGCDFQRLVLWSDPLFLTELLFGMKESGDDDGEEEPFSLTWKGNASFQGSWWASLSMSVHAETSWQETGNQGKVVHPVLHWNQSWNTHTHLGPMLLF